MKEGDYKVIITVYEAQELEPKKAELFSFLPMNKSAVDGFVEVEVMGQTRKTAVRQPLLRFAKRQTTRSGRNRSTSSSRI